MVRFTDHTVIDRSRLIVHAQLTDNYLLALAQGDRMAAFGKRLVADAVIGGRAAVDLIPMREPVECSLLGHDVIVRRYAETGRE